MSKTYRECAIEHLKQGNLCKGYIDYIVDEVEKIEKIEQIINCWEGTNVLPENDWKYISEIKKVLEQE